MTLAGSSSTKKCKNCEQEITTSPCAGCLAEIPATCVSITTCNDTESTLQTYLDAECAAKGKYTIQSVCKDAEEVSWWKIGLMANFTYSPANFFTIFFKRTINGVTGYFPIFTNGVSQIYTNMLASNNFSVYVPMPTEVPIITQGVVSTIEFIIIDNLGNISDPFIIESDDFTISNGNGIIDAVCS